MAKVNIPPPALKRLIASISLGRIFNVRPIICGVDEINEESWLKMLIAYPPENIQKIIDFVYERPEYTNSAHWVRSENQYFEMLPIGVNKGSGFQKLQRTRKYQPPLP